MINEMKVKTMLIIVKQDKVLTLVKTMRYLIFLWCSKNIASRERINEMKVKTMLIIVKQDKVLTLSICFFLLNVLFS